jgi:hypothetical protein
MCTCYEEEHERLDISIQAQSDLECPFYKYVLRGDFRIYILAEAHAFRAKIGKMQSFPTESETEEIPSIPIEDRSLKVRLKIPNIP